MQLSVMGDTVTVFLCGRLFIRYFCYWATHRQLRGRWKRLIRCTLEWMTQNSKGLPICLRMVRFAGLCFSCFSIWKLTDGLIDLTSTHPFNGPFSGTTQVSRYQKGKINLDFTKARDSEWQWHQLGHMQVCTSLQPDNHTSTPPLLFFTSRTFFLLPNQQRQSTEGNWFDKQLSKF